MPELVCEVPPILSSAPAYQVGVAFPHSIRHLPMNDSDQTRASPSAHDSYPNSVQDAHELARAALVHLQGTTGQVRVLCTAADADPLVAPFLEEIERAGFGSRISLHCAWNRPWRVGEVALAPASRRYGEPFRESPSDVLLLVQTGLFDDTQAETPHLQGVSTAKTNISHALDGALPDAIVVASVVSERGAFGALLREFPAHLLDRFVPTTLRVVQHIPQKLTFAEYRDIPELVRTRRTRFA